MAKQRVILDANVLYGQFSRDLLLSLFAAKMYEAKWTEKITQEWVGHLLKNNENVTPEKNKRTLAFMNGLKPFALITHYEQRRDRWPLFGLSLPKFNPPAPAKSKNRCAPSELALMLPRCAWMMACMMVRPSPVPSDAY